MGSLLDSILPDMPEPSTLLYWRDQYLYLQASLSEVQRAWRQHHKAQHVRHVFPLLRHFTFFRQLIMVSYTAPIAPVLPSPVSLDAEIQRLQQQLAAEVP